MVFLFFIVVKEEIIIYEEIRLVIFGKIGFGKSVIGNSIFGKDYFILIIFGIFIICKCE